MGRVRQPAAKHGAALHIGAGGLGDGTKSHGASSVGDGASSSFGSAGASPRVSEPSESTERHYVQALLDSYRRLPGTPRVTSRCDRKCAQALFRRGVPLGMVQGAMVVAVARRTFRRCDPLPRIRALHFFLPVVEELLEVPCDPGYVQYLKSKLEAFAGQDIHLHRGEAAQPETCRVGRGSPPLHREAPSSRGR
jgi:hypothetical protein